MKGFASSCLSSFGCILEQKLRLPFLVILANRFWLTFFFCMRSLLTFVFLFCSSKVSTSFCSSYKVFNKCKITSKTMLTTDEVSKERSMHPVINDNTKRKRLMRVSPKTNHQKNQTNERLNIN